ncbi:MAG: hypothetical protein AAB792_01325 [Patescibacteria group bacterium]
MNFQPKIVLWVVIFLAGAGLIAFSSIFRDTKKISVSSPTPSPTGSSPSPSPKPLLSSSAGTPVPSNQIGKPVACQIGGSINFIDKNLYQTKGAQIAYQNVDHPARLIFWKIVPDDGSLKVGPNIFSGLPLPNGERPVGASIDKEPTVSFYSLTAAISYGVTDSRGVEKIYNADCTGLVTITAPPK